MDDDDRPAACKARCGLAAELALESLDAWSLDELAERVALLEAEIARVQAHRGRAAAHRMAADALFRPGPK